MKIIDGEVYVNKKDAFNAMEEEIKVFEENSDSELSSIVELTILAFLVRLFKGEAKDEH